jgi:hypothetical protein
VLIAPSAYVDFTSRRSLHEVALELSRSVFGGIPFVGEGEGIWDEVPALRLAKRFMGLQVELGGSPGDGGYTLQVEAPDFPWHLIDPAKQQGARVDLTGLLRHLLADVRDLTLVEAVAGASGTSADGMRQGITGDD